MQVSGRVAELLEKAMALTQKERGVLVDRLTQSLHDSPAHDEAEDGGVEAAWDEEIKSRVEEVRSGKVKLVPGKEVMGRLRLRHAKK